MTQQTRIINIEGMTCNGCVNSIHDVVSKLTGVQSIEVSLENKRATVSFDTDQISVERIAESIEEAGFDATVANS